MDCLADVLQGCEFFLKEIFHPEQGLNKAGRGFRAGSIFDLFGRNVHGKLQRQAFDSIGGS